MDRNREINDSHRWSPSSSPLFRLSLTLSLRLMNKSRRKAVENILKEEKERCSGSYRLAVGFLVIKDESISERPG